MSTLTKTILPFVLLVLFASPNDAQSVATLKTSAVPFGSISDGNTLANRGTFTDTAKQYAVKDQQGSFCLISDGTREGWVFRSMVELKAGNGSAKPQTTSNSPANAKVFDAYAVRVLDGDTFTAKTNDGSTFNVRLNSIDAPESKQVYGLEATRELKRLLTGRVLRIETKSKDRYKRVLADVYVGGVNVNESMIKTGHAWHYKKYSKDQRLAKLEDGAQDARRGFWQHTWLVPPWDYRNGVRTSSNWRDLELYGERPKQDVRSTRTTDKTVYVTEYGSKYHRSGCRHLSKSRIPIPISRAHSAYERCKHCNP